MSAKKIIEDAESLPVEERAVVVDSLLKGLNPPSDEIDQKWIVAARRRLEEIRSGAVEAVPGKDVFDRIRERFA